MGYAEKYKKYNDTLNQKYGSPAEYRDLSLSEAKEYLLSISKNKPQVIGFTPAIFASLEVSETVKYILNRENVVLAPKVLMWDLFDNSSFRLIDF